MNKSLEPYNKPTALDNERNETYFTKNKTLTKMFLMKNKIVI